MGNLACYGDPMEVWLQKRQIHRAHKIHQQSTARRLATGQLLRVRLLLRRESQCRSSPLEPGQRTSFGRIPEAPGHNVQWLRSGSQPLLRYGPEKELLGIL